MINGPEKGFHTKDFGAVGDASMWKHACPAEGEHYVGRDEPCNWCGMTEDRERHYDQSR
jgi:hypothetical protein